MRLLVQVRREVWKADIGRAGGEKKNKIGSTVQDYIHLMRQALSTRDSNMALHVLRQYEAGAKGGMDVSIHNAALATLFGSGEVERAQEIFAEMTAKGLPNVVTYNTMVKVYCARGDVTNTRSLLRQMEKNGIEPDAVTYNSLLDCTVKTGAMPDALQVLDEMEATGLPFDKYTVSIMMKAARRARCPRDACMALAILDRSPGLDICGDDVALNMVLHACLHHQSTHYLELVLNRFLASDVRPSATTCSLLHQAAGTPAQGLPQRLSALELKQELSQRLSAIEVEQPTNGRNSAPDTQQLRRVISTHTRTLMFILFTRLAARETNLSFASYGLSTFGQSSTEQDLRLLDFKTCARDF